MDCPSRSLKLAIDFLALVMTGFWPVIGRQLVDGGVEDLGVRDRLAHAHVQDDLLDLGNGHRVLDPELVLELLADFLLVMLFESCCHLGSFWLGVVRPVDALVAVLGVRCSTPELD